jgi:hypothetical protein
MVCMNLMFDGVDESWVSKDQKRVLRFHAENIGNQNGLVPLFIAYLANAIDELHARHPFLHRDLVFTREVVDMLN